MSGRDNGWGAAGATQSVNTKGKEEKADSFHEREADQVKIDGDTCAISLSYGSVGKNENRCQLRRIESCAHFMDSCQWSSVHVPMPGRCESDGKHPEFKVKRVRTCIHLSRSTLSV